MRASTRGYRKRLFCDHVASSGAALIQKRVGISKAANSNAA